MTKNKAIKIGACALAGAVLCGALVYYNFIEKEQTGAMLYDDCPDFTLSTYKVEGDKFVVSGETITLSQMVGEKVIVLNFWATYCQPCREEIPHFNEFYEEYKDSVEVVIINGETSVSAQSLLDDFVNNPSDTNYEKNYSKWTEYSCTFARYEKDNNVLGLFEVESALPVTVIIDKAGKIKYMESASLSYEELEELVKKEL